MDKPVVRDRGERSAATHNIWTGRRIGGAGGGGGRPEQREHKGSQHRCRPKIDTGKTRGSGAGVTTFCLFFVR